MSRHPDGTLAYLQSHSNVNSHPPGQTLQELSVHPSSVQREVERKLMSQGNDPPGEAHQPDRTLTTSWRTADRNLKDKSRKRRDLKGLISLCREFGDTSDKSFLLTSWNFNKRFPSDPSADPRYLHCYPRLKVRVRELVVKLEALLQRSKAVKSIDEKAKDVVGERYWEVSPLTSTDDPLRKTGRTPEWPSAQFESWALYLETQIMFASLSLVLGYHHIRMPVEDKWGLTRAMIRTKAGTKTRTKTLTIWTMAISILTPPIRMKKILSLPFRLSRPISWVRTMLYSLTPGYINAPFEKSNAWTKPIRLSYTFLLALKLQLEVSYGRFEGEFLAREVDKFITTRSFQERNDAEGKHSLDHAGAILYLNEINRTSPSRNIFDELRYPVDFLDRLFALAHRSIRQTYRGTVLLAVGRRFPLEICKKNILDWIDAAHSVPDSLRGYMMQLQLAGSQMAALQMYNWPDSDSDEF